MESEREFMLNAAERGECISSKHKSITVPKPEFYRVSILSEFENDSPFTPLDLITESTVQFP